MNISFMQGALVALGLALVTAAATSLLPSPTFSWHLTLVSSFSLVTILYLVYQLAHSPRKAGRLTMAGIALLLLTAQYLSAMSLTGVLLTNVTFLWVVRTWLYLTTPLQALVDLALWAVGLIAGLFVFGFTGSPAFAVWTLFLTVALWPALARRTVNWLTGRTGDGPLTATGASISKRSVQVNSDTHSALLQRLRAANQNADNAMRNLN